MFVEVGDGVFVWQQVEEMADEVGLLAPAPFSLHEYLSGCVDLFSGTLDAVIRSPLGFFLGTAVFLVVVYTVAYLVRSVRSVA